MSWTEPEATDGNSRAVKDKPFTELTPGGLTLATIINRTLQDPRTPQAHLTTQDRDETTSFLTVDAIGEVSLHVRGLHEEPNGQLIYLVAVFLDENRATMGRASFWKAGNKWMGEIGIIRNIGYHRMRDNVRRWKEWGGIESADFGLDNTDPSTEDEINAFANWLDTAQPNAELTQRASPFYGTILRPGILSTTASVPERS